MAKPAPHTRFLTLPREFDARACQDAGSMFFDPAAARGEAAH
jgi:hypothetical protein